MTQVIYLGPTMATAALTISTGTIYNGKLPPSVTEKMESDNNFKALFITPEHVGKARIDIRQANSFLGACYARVLADYRNKEVK
ncbi:hypothetical protein [Klebsiella oxytoca]|uniref:hypothetical protein n=1 Tax=Klebsiella oxytoca TaxID=571 RepID=UPI0022469889|nr:hypothetical protein [Klebsiella oxytoca]MCW9548015.1 hypothetical protein [Klebsiella oxytoca]